MICNNCKQKLPDDSEFCQYCGNKIVPVEVAEEIQNKNSEKAPEPRQIASDDPLKAIMREQAQTTIATMEANRIGQADHENEVDFGLVPEKPIYTLATDIVEGEHEYLANLRVAPSPSVYFAASQLLPLLCFCYFFAKCQKTLGLNMRKDLTVLSNQKLLWFSFLP